MADMSVAQCAPCLKSGIRQNASVHCDTCDQFQCQECFCVHELYDFMAGHTFEDLLSPMSLVRAQSQDLFSCDVHNKPYEIFCEDHKVLCCSYCAAESHRKCKHVRAVGQQVPRTHIKPSDMIECIKETKKLTSKTLERITSVCNGLHAKLNAVSSRVQSVKQKTVLKAKSTEPYDRHLKSLLQVGRLQEKYLEKLYRNALELFTFYEAWVNSQDLNRCFVGNCAVRHRLADIVKETCYYLDGLHEIDVSVSVNNTLTYINNTNKVFNILYSISTFSPKGSPNCCIPFQIHEITNRSIRLKKKFGGLCFNGIDFLRDGRLAVTENFQNLVVILNEDMEEVSSIALQKTPLDVTTISESKLVVSTRDHFSLSVIHIESSGNIVRSESITGQIFDMDSYYNSVCKYSEDTVVVGLAIKRRIAQKFNFVTGEIWRFNSKLPYKTWKILGDAATVAFIKCRNLLVVAERRKNLIFICDVSEKTSGHITVANENIQDPRGMAVGSNDCVFVCCYKSHKVVQISPSGHILCVYGLSPELYPKDICFSTDGKKLFVLFDDSNYMFLGLEISDFQKVLCFEVTEI